MRVLAKGCGRGSTFSRTTSQRLGQDRQGCWWSSRASRSVETWKASSRSSTGRVRGMMHGSDPTTPRSLTPS
eukprot:12927587-Prorocentrum_lima.AAC.1